MRKQRDLFNVQKGMVIGLWADGVNIYESAHMNFLYATTVKVESNRKSVKG